MAHSDARENRPVLIGERVSSLFPVIRTESRHCEAHGAFQADLVRLPIGERWSECLACMQERVKAEDAKLARESELERNKLRMEHMLGRAAIPKRFLDKTLANYVAETDGQAKALRAATRYAEEWEPGKSPSLIMCGKPGTGKTHLASGIARAIMEKNGSVLFCRLIEMARAVKETYSRSATRTETQVIHDFAEPDLLILDEIGHQHGSDTERMILFDVINARYEECRPSILITNLGLPDLKNYLDERAEDRLREGGGRVIVFDWESYRGKL